MERYVTAGGTETGTGLVCACLFAAGLLFWNSDRLLCSLQLDPYVTHCHYIQLSHVSTNSLMELAVPFITLLSSLVLFSHLCTSLQQSWPYILQLDSQHPALTFLGVDVYCEFFSLNLFFP